MLQLSLWIQGVGLEVLNARSRVRAELARSIGVPLDWLVIVQVLPSAVMPALEGARRLIADSAVQIDFEVRMAKLIDASLQGAGIATESSVSERVMETLQHLRQNPSSLASDLVAVVLGNVSSARLTLRLSRPSMQQQRARLVHGPWSPCGGSDVPCAASGRHYRHRKVWCASEDNGRIHVEWIYCSSTKHPVHTSELCACPSTASSRQDGMDIVMVLSFILGAAVLMVVGCCFTYAFFRRSTSSHPYECKDLEEEGKDSDERAVVNAEEVEVVIGVTQQTATGQSASIDDIEPICQELTEDLVLEMPQASSLNPMMNALQSASSVAFDAWPGREIVSVEPTMPLRKFKLDGIPGWAGAGQQVPVL